MRMRTIREAHKELKASDPNSALGLTTLYRLVSEGTIPSVPVGKKYLIDLDKLEEYLMGSPAPAGEVRS